MKSKLNSALALFLGSLIPSASIACDNVFVRTMNGGSGAATVGITMDSVPADSLGFTLASTASRIDTLPVGPESPNPLHLNANVMMGSLQANCATNVTNDNVSGQCSGVIDPKYQLNVSYTPAVTTTVTTPGTGGDCKHDNGNHWGEYRRLGITALAHSGKPGAECKNNGKNKGGSTTPTTTTVVTTPASLSCQFVLVPSF